MMETLAVYITPPKNDPLYRVATQVLGYDIWTGRKAVHEPYTYWVGGACKFGFHCTIGDALVYRDSDIDEIKLRLTSICADITPFSLSNFFLDHEFWAGSELLVMGFHDLSDRLSKLAGLIATTINPLHVDSPYYPKLLPRLSEYSEEYFKKYGSPKVLEHYVPHFTLASSIPDEAARAQLVSFIEREFLAQQVNYLQEIDRIHLVRQKPDEFYEIINSYMLGTGETV